MAVTAVEATERNVVETRRKFQSTSETVTTIPLLHSHTVQHSHSCIWYISKECVTLCMTLFPPLPVRCLHRKNRLHHRSLASWQLSGKREFEVVTGAEGWILAFWTMALHSLVCKSYPFTGLDGPIGLQEVEAPRNSRQLAHGSGNIVSPKHRSSLSPRRYPWYWFLLEAESTPGP